MTSSASAASTRPAGPVHEPDGPRRRDRRVGPGADNQVIGALLMLLGVAWLLQRSGIVALSWETILSVLLVVLGVGLVITSRRHGGTALVVIGVWLSIALAATSSLDVAVLRSGVGNRLVSAETTTDARRVTSLFVGELVVDLHALDVPQDASTRVSYRLGVGDLQVVVPSGDDVGVRIEASTRMGQIDMFGEQENGSNVDVVFEDDGFDSASRKLVLHLDVGIGKVTVTRGVAPALG